MSAQLIEQLAPVPSLLTEENRTALAAVKTNHNTALFAWAVRELVQLGDARRTSYGDDAVSMAQALAACTDLRGLLKAWIIECRKRMGLSEIPNARVDQLLGAQIVYFSTADGFRAVASQFKQHSPTLSMETSVFGSVHRPSTPPIVGMGGSVSLHQ